MNGSKVLLIQFWSTPKVIANDCNIEKSYKNLINANTLAAFYLNCINYENSKQINIENTTATANSHTFI